MGNGNTDGYFINKESWLYILNNLADLTGVDAQKLSIGNALTEKLTANDIAIATNKNWILAQ